MRRMSQHEEDDEDYGYGEDVLKLEEENGLVQPRSLRIEISAPRPRKKLSPRDYPDPSGPLKGAVRKIVCFSTRCSKKVFQPPGF
jgi:hypothetical protein